MNNLGSSQSFYNSKIVDNKSSGFGNQQKKNFDNKFADINLEISKLKSKYEKHTKIQEKLKESMEKEIKLREETDKKAFLINENISKKMQKLKEEFIDEIKSIKNNEEKIKEDFIQKFNQLTNKNKENLQNLLEANNNKNLDDYDLKIQELSNEIKLIKEELKNKIQNLGKNIKEINQEILYTKNQLANNNILVNEEINQIKNEIIIIKKEFELCKVAKNNVSNDMYELIKEIESINQKLEIITKEINNNLIEVQAKLNNYEASNRLFEENFSNIKEEFLQQLDKINNLKKNDLERINEQVFSQINQIKSDMDKFNINIIQENQKFIDFSQNQLQEHDNNMKKLFEFTSDDIDVLKKKSDTLENLLKNTRNEMINNINSMEGFLTKRYDSLFKPFGSIGKEENKHF